MSLLARRRTSNAVTQLSAESLAANRAGNDFNATFDPRIKGTVVHDFSAPRPRRIVSSNDVRQDENQNIISRQYPRSPNPQQVEASMDENGPWSGGDYRPAFTENFEEEQYPAAGPHVRKASDISDLPLPRPPYAQGAPRPQEPTSTSGNVASQQQTQANRTLPIRKPVGNVPPPVPPKSEDRPGSKRISIDPAATPPKSTPSSRTARSRNVSEVSAKDATGIAIPKHMKSTSSRFSFDMIGAAEQERLLEDRHRQRALEKKKENADNQDEEEDDYDYDNMDDDDGLEERIPGVNADLEEDPNEFYEEEIPGVNADLEPEEGILDNHENFAGFTFQQRADTPLSPYSPDTISTPRDANGEVIGFAMTKNSPYPSIDTAQTLDASPNLSESSTPSIAPKVASFYQNPEAHGLGLQGMETNIAPDAKSMQVEPPNLEGDFPRPSEIDDDDLYFDDGIIEELGEDDGAEFDESVFDNIDTDEYGRPLKAFSSLPTLYSPPNLTADPSPSFNKIVESDETVLKAAEENTEGVSPGTIAPTGGLAPQASVAGNAFSSVALPTFGLTQDTLAAYQSALAAATLKAAADGKFRRDSTPPHPATSDDDAQPGLVPDSSHTSHCEPFSPFYEDEFDYDDALEDDPIIAAANAEALAYDTDGFYGQEFGFYSAPAAGEAEYANGGYFGPRGIEGVNRSQSGRVVSREPNLTPITERSEYSNRNSFMSLMHGPGSVTSPGLAQLAGLMSQPEYDGDMSLNALLKLRRGAWGGSQASLHSSNGGSPRSAAEESSPVGQIPPWAQGGAVNLPAGGGHRRANSAFSLVSEVQSEASSSPASPTLTMAMPALESTNTRSPGKESRSHSRSQSQSQSPDKEKDLTKKHRYTGSADSISYLKEDDPHSPTGERWILERRRTSELGEELLGREVVSGTI